MARYLQRGCPNCCPDICPDTGKPAATVSCLLIGSSAGVYTLKCEKCANVFNDKAPTERHLGQFKYPHYCASTDQTFRDRSEEKAFVKANGLEVAD